MRARLLDSIARFPSVFMGFTVLDMGTEASSLQDVQEITRAHHIHLSCNLVEIQTNIKVLEISKAVRIPTIDDCLLEFQL